MAAPVFGAVRMIALGQLRRRWPSLVALGLLVGLVGAVVGGAAALTRRTGTAPARLERATAVPDLQITVPAGPGLAARAAAVVPGLQSVWVTAASAARVENRPGVVYLGMLAGHPVGSDVGVYTPVVVKGRNYDPNAAEAVLDERTARSLGVKVDDVLTLRALTRDDYFNFDTGFGTPHGARFTVRVTGLVRMAGATAQQTPLLLSPAVAGDIATVGITVMIKLVSAPDAVARADTALARAAATAGDEQDPQAAEFPLLEVQHPATDSDARVGATTRVLLTGLVAFAVVVGVTGLATAAVAFGRHHYARLTEQRIEAVLGVTPAGRAAARVLAAVPAAALAGLVAATGPLLAGRLEPIGPLADLEPHPGYTPNLAVAGITEVAAIGLVLALSGWSAARAGRGRAATGAARAAGPVRASWLSPGPAWAGPAWLWVGTRFALTGHRPSSGRRPSVITAMISVAALVAAATVAHGIDRLIRDPSRYGWTADLDLLDARPDIVARLKVDPWIAAVSLVARSTVLAGDGCDPADTADEGPSKGSRAAPAARPGPGCVEVTAYAVHSATGQQGWTMLSGRTGRGPGEAVVGTHAAHDLGVEVGDVLNLAPSPGDGDGARVTVVGIGLGPPVGGERLGDNLLLDPGVLERTQRTAPWWDGLVTAADGVPVASLVGDLGDEYEVAPRQPPTEVANLGGIGRLPEVLQMVLGGLAAIALVHSVTTSWRRRAGEAGVLRTLGSTPAQTAAAAVTAACVTALGAVGVGIPLGLGVGRLVWWEIASATGVGGDAAFPGGLLLMLPPAALVIGALAALVPAPRNAWLRPSVHSRSG
ncbi:FtsX-like permease family protein [Pseudofrankia saprophytica]|uniref:FtsX-like permease family protein n=1 Tax=Pseudofrankia saprophytica TaxID=298655 RepID=UPI00068888A0|nr:FtsX-like permease family protein [Pseudofrankia saprophytica]